MAVADSSLEDLESVVGSDLRAVIIYDRTGFDEVFLQTNLGPESLERRFAAWHDRLILNQVQLADLREALDKDLEMSMYCLNGITIVQIPQSRYTGVVITIEPDADSVLGLRKLCQEFMD